jgi:hypothetical protein
MRASPYSGPASSSLLTRGGVRRSSSQAAISAGSKRTSLPTFRYGTAPFGDESANGAGGNAELFGELVDGEEVGDGLGGSHGWVSGVVVVACEDRPGCQQPAAMVLYQ